MLDDADTKKYVEGTRVFFLGGGSSRDAQWLILDAERVEEIILSEQ